MVVDIAYEQCIMYSSFKSIEELTMTKIRLTEHRKALNNNSDAYTHDYKSGRLYKTIVKHIKDCGYNITPKRNSDIVKEIVDLLFESQGYKPYLFIDNQLPLCWNQPKDWYRDGMDIIKYEWGHLRSRNDNGENAHYIDNLALLSARCNQIQTSMNMDELKFYGGKICDRIEEMETSREKLFSSKRWLALTKKLEPYKNTANQSN